MSTNIGEDRRVPLLMESSHAPVECENFEPDSVKNSTSSSGGHGTIVTKQSTLPLAKISHSRSGSDKELPKLPPDRQPISTLDTNISNSKYPVIVTKRTTSKDWNGASVLLTPTREESSPIGSHRSHRVWLQPTASEEDIRESPKLPLPHGSQDSVRASADSVVSDYISANSKLPTPTFEITPQVEDPPEPIRDPGETLETSPSEPTDEDRILAKKIFSGDDDTIEHSAAAAWLGDSGADRTRVRTAYMELFDWHNLNILVALRSFCNQLLLKAETQQVDRILDAFSIRWCVCNPNHGFKATGKDRKTTHILVADKQFRRRAHHMLFYFAAQY